MHAAHLTLSFTLFITWSAATSRKYLHSPRRCRPSESVIGHPVNIRLFQFRRDLSISNGKDISSDSEEKRTDLIITRLACYRSYSR